MRLQQRRAVAGASCSGTRISSGAQSARAGAWGWVEGVCHGGAQVGMVHRPNQLTVCSSGDARSVAGMSVVPVRQQQLPGMGCQ